MSTAVTKLLARVVEGKLTSEKAAAILARHLTNKVDERLSPTAQEPFRAWGKRGYARYNLPLFQKTNESVDESKAAQHADDLRLANETASKKTLHELADHESPRVRQAVAGNVAAHPKTLHKLAGDKHPSVRAAVTRTSALSTRPMSAYASRLKS